jgi:hypothetical protein
MPQARLIMYHVRFLKTASGSVCCFDPLPKLSQLMEEAPDENLTLHPAAYVNQAAQWLGLPSEELEAEGEYHAWVDVPDGTIQVFLVRFTSIDPPFGAADAQGAEFVELPQARNLPPAELELLRKAYELVMGG